MSHDDADKTERTIDEALQKVIREKQTRAEQDTKLGEYHEELRERILNGGTTGDPLRDFVFVHYHGVGAEELAPYRALEACVKYNLCKPILFIATHKIKHCHRMLGGDREEDFHHVNHHALGILTGPIEWLVRDTREPIQLAQYNGFGGGGRVVFPTARYLTGSQDQLAAGERHDGPLIFDPLIALSLEQSVDGKTLVPDAFQAYGNSGHGRILIGAAVDAYVRKTAWLDAGSGELPLGYADALKTLGG